jgi:RNA polymerase sigma factor (sigma-70 family)
MGDGLDVVRNAAVRRCQSAGATAEEAEDSVHDALVTMLEAPDGAPVHKPGAWVATVSHRRWVDHVRRGSRERVVLQREQVMKGPDLDPADVVADRDQAQWLVASLKALPKTTQDVCWAVGKGKSQNEVAKDFGITPRSVESHLTRARRLLRGLRIVAFIPAIAAVERMLRRWPGVPEVAAATMPVAVTVAVVMLPAASVPPPQPPPNRSIVVEAPGTTPTGSVLPSSEAAIPEAPAVSVPSTPVSTTEAPPTTTTEAPPATTASPAAKTKISAKPPELTQPKPPVKPLLSSLPTIPALPPILPHPIAPGQIVGGLLNDLHIPTR